MDLLKKIPFIFIFFSLLIHAQDPFLRAKASFVKDDLNDCLKALDSCSSTSPYADSALYLRAYVALKSGQYDKASGYCSELYRRNKNFYEVWFLRGLIASIKNKYAAAAEDFTRVLNKQPEHLKALYNRALAKGNLEDFEGAILDLDKCILVDPKYTSAYYSRGYWHEALQNYEAALADYAQAISLDPDFTEAYLPLAYVLNKKGDRQKACEMVQLAFEKGVNAAGDLKDTFCK